MVRVHKLFLILNSRASKLYILNIYLYVYIQPIVNSCNSKKCNFYFEINVNKNQCFSIRPLIIHIWESKYQFFKNKALFVS